MSFWVPARRYDPELMDAEGNSRESLDAALADIRGVNRWLGGTGNLLEALEPYAKAPLRILDIGTGCGDVPLAICKRFDAEVTAVDFDPVTVELAREHCAHEPRVTVERRDAFALPYDDRSFDVVTASMFLHHFDEADSIKLLKEFRRVAGKAVLINDLRRHRLPWLFIAAVSRATFRSAMFRHDAPLSVLRGFTVDELQTIAEASGARDATVSRRWPFRLAATMPA